MSLGSSAWTIHEISKYGYKYITATPRPFEPTFLSILTLHPSLLLLQTAHNMPPLWWKEAVGYQIWPTSFKDSNNDGIGDLNGVISKLDHVKNLGADFIWLSPVYDSPQADGGYDIRDYESIWAPFGTLQDMDNLIAAAHDKGLKVVMDLVVNHTSDEHNWFLQSKASRDNPFSDWYLWRDPRYDEQGRRKSPCNWRAAFGGGVWTYVPERDQYYLHLCQPKQPDLNWHNPAVRDAIYISAVDFWLKRGVDGFRVDVVNFYWKDPAFPDARVLIEGAEWQPMEVRHVMNHDAVREWVSELRGRIARDHGRYVPFIGELPGVDRDGVLDYIAGEDAALDMVLDMDILRVGNEWNKAMHEMDPVDWPSVKSAMLKTQSLRDSPKDAWPTAFLENHDHSRSLSLFGPGNDPQYRDKAAKLLALMLGSLSGTLFIYQGQEIGMTNTPLNWERNDFRDCATLRYFSEIDAKHRLGEASILPEDAVKAANKHGRDNARTPVQWSSDVYAGFSAVEPWIRVNENFADINVAEQTGRPDSVLSFWQDLIKLRKAHKELFVHSSFEVIDQESDKTVCFLKRSKDGDSGVLLVALNVSDQEVSIPPLPRGLDVGALRPIFGTEATFTTDKSSSLKHLGPWEGRAYVL